MKHFPNFKEAQSCGREMLDDLKHAVGYPEFNRNSYAVDSGVVNESLRWECLVSLGLATRGPVIPDEAGRYYYVAPAGLEFLRRLPMTE